MSKKRNSKNGARIEETRTGNLYMNDQLFQFKIKSRFWGIRMLYQTKYKLGAVNKRRK